MSRTTVIVGNWKMHKTIAETLQFIKVLIPKIVHSMCQVMIAPPFTALSAAASATKKTNVIIGAQNMSDIEEGAFTGEISLKMLQEAGARFVILGHSERRIHFKETDEKIHLKVRKAAEKDFPVILCIGENLSQRNSGESLHILKDQLTEGLKDLSNTELKGLMIAYEPIWAIGTGEAATPEVAQEAHMAVRKHLENMLGASFAEKLPILYGGSVKPDNVKGFLDQKDIDGVLVGGASLDVETFTQMILP